MKIGIIGTGAIGGTIAKKMVVAGHNVKVYNTDEPDKLIARAKELGAEVSTLDTIAKDADVVILSVPTIAIPDLSKSIFEGVSNDVIIIDTSNYYPFRDAEIEDLKSGKTESVWVSEQLGRPVIKAFNNLLAHSLEHSGKDKGQNNRIAMAISGDNENAKRIVSELINDAGFDTVDAGNLSDSWRHQPGTPAYCTELNVEELKQALADANRDKAAKIRDYVISQFMDSSVAPTSHQGVVDLNRAQFQRNPKTH